MNKSLEILKAIYKPYRYTIKGKTTILETTSGDFIIKPKNKDMNELILNNEGLKEYIKKNLSSVIEIIINATEQNTLDKIFITQKFIV